ncbi:MAG: hypothetical protein UW65_C0022G0014 [candidate division WWE3 bacterium GW2011_GWB1_44_4]|uniref:Polymerase nucleotidyl transferase domain-containing protein n=1 Tax=candidate division WWE3 bacterium GW2011_GWB1_44_4 TaxID=1619116 RepID=A0A0G1JD03_UNCKA|nr:MAG: hypothetical protein UW65_C0022G0014 [candidate division WWE3 bacterium GW2011_GWB1_44_4]
MLDLVKTILCVTIPVQRGCFRCQNLNGLEDDDSKSDIDLLVEFSVTPSLMKHVGIEYELSENLFNNRKVDLITKRSINKDIAPNITKDFTTLYEKR